ncbi:uncharacterized protein BYT42DRAFT_563925 [Radiomyces spectabilis]|uniref:uncharacterized protein n=1 Tax=Radiomyces spectabilis TaxID=64574 RepID=UPI00221E8AE4|nr:uncharacterized protein BYT42DRAFT_563925 [Radiomyces spectabilis]KAI8384875.1 hypothetical protein BYT42DRAFT_563925 [Radiomyces spectabilis]
MDVEARDALGRLIKDITETGEWTLDAQKLKVIKSYCKRSNENIDSAYGFIMAQLKKEHAQIRYSTVQLCEELFQRSHHFRSLLTDDLPLFIELTVGIHQKALPPPAQVAIKLKKYAVALIKNWLEKFGDLYRPLSIGYDYLDHNGVLDQSMESLATIHVHDRDKANRQARVKAIQERRYEHIKIEMEEQLELIQENLKSMESCFEILVPKNADDTSIDFDALMKGDMAASNRSTDDAYKQSILSHGLASNRYKITIDLSENLLEDQVQESEENEIIYEQLREAYTLMETKHIKQVTQWMNTLVKLEYTDSREKEKLIKQLIDVKAAMTEAGRKAKLLGIQVMERRKSKDDRGTAAEEDEDEFLNELFEEVDIPTETSEKAESSSGKLGRTISSTKLPPGQRIFPLAYEPAMSEDVTYSGARVRSESPSDKASSDASHDTNGKGKQPEDPLREELLKRAPVVEWGDDLYYWDKTSVQFNTSGIERSHRFMGVGEGTNEMPQHLLEELRKRPLYYKSDVKQNLKACRAPLHNGSLCPRRDLVTCPFHGKIIPRDELGRPVRPEDQVSTPVEDDPRAPESPSLWQQLEGDVMQQAGQERIDSNAKRRKKQTKKSALIDVRKKPESSYTRLQKRLDDPKLRRLVEEAAEYEQSLKARNKQANAWGS